MTGMFQKPQGAGAPPAAASTTAADQNAADIMRRRAANDGGAQTEGLATKASNLADQGSSRWSDFKKDQPAAALALSVLPITGQITAAAEFYDAMKRGDNADAAMAAVQLLPFGGVLKGVKVARAAIETAKDAKNTMATAKAWHATASASARSSRIAGDLIKVSEAQSSAAKMQALRAATGVASDGANVIEYANTK